jgi:hypothetical protein
VSARLKPRPPRFRCWLPLVSSPFSSQSIMVVCQWTHIPGVLKMTHLEDLLEAAKKFVLTQQEKEEQRRSFAYGNTKIGNSRITREMVDREAEALGTPKHAE